MQSGWNYKGITMLGILACACSAAAEVAPRPARQTPAPSAKQNVANIEKIVHQYLLDHPEVLLESIQRFQQSYHAEQAAEKRKAVGKLENELNHDAASPTLERGAKSAEPVSVVAFLDYQCGYCKRSDETLAKLATMPGVRVVYKEFPILGPDSLRAAKASLAAGKQNAYQAFHDALMKSTGPVTAERVNQVVAELKLDAARFKTDMESPEVSAAIEKNRKLAEKLNVQSTPTFVVGRELVAGALSEEGFKPLIEAARQQQRVAVARPPAAGR
jgi:protein-disulfide isomerase